MADYNNLRDRRIELLILYPGRTGVLIVVLIVVVLGVRQPSYKKHQ